MKSCNFINAAIFLSLLCFGSVSIAATSLDAKALSTRLDEPKYHLGKFLSVVQSGTDYKPKARKHFQELRDFSAIAAVVSSPILRTAINLMLRLMHDGAGIVRLFTSEQEALAWLEEQPLREPK